MRSGEGYEKANFKFLLDIFGLVAVLSASSLSQVF